MTDIGYIALLIALFSSTYSAIAFGFGAKKPSPMIKQSAKNGLIASVSLVTISVLILTYAIFSHDFQLEYVASYTSLHTSPLYLVSALWAGNSGSLLFWAWLLSLFSLVVIIQKNSKSKDLIPYAGMVLMATQAFFLLLLVVVTNPFNRLPSAPPDGMGLNPMLQNLGMVFHPPALLAGYVGFTIPFAFAEVQS